MIENAEMIIRLVLACILGGFIGYERTARNKSAGLRTHVLVCLGSCLIMVLSYNIYRNVQGVTNADPARLAAQVVSGIGFLGAGTIMKEGSTIKGLTTAASLWVVSGVGLAVGGGFYLGALATTILVLSTLIILPHVEKFLNKGPMITLAMKVRNQPGQIGKIGAELGNGGFVIHDIKIDKQNSNYIYLSVTIRCEEDTMKFEKIANNLMSIEGVLSIQR